MSHEFIVGGLLLLAALFLVIFIRSARKANRGNANGPKADVSPATLNTEATINTVVADCDDCDPALFTEFGEGADDHEHSGQLHSHPQWPADAFGPEPGDLDPVHKGKDNFRGCKFDPVIANRTKSLRRPRIVLSNLPTPDARLVAAMNGIDIKRLTDVIEKLSGEKPMTVGGKTLTLVTRNSHTNGIDTALAFVEEQYQAMGNGITVTRHAYKIRGKTFYNIIAERRGDTNPEKIVVVGAHLDSTAGSPWGAESRCPGADDDASGTASVLELARNIAALPLGYTVRFCHFTGEEQGLWGSYAYSDKLAKEGADVVAMIEMDMVGYCAKPGNRLDIHDGANKNGSHDLVVMFTRNVAAYGINLNVFDTHNHAVDDRSDHAGFLDHGWKAVLLSEEFTEGDGFNPNYHTTGDRISACNLPYMVEVNKALLVTTCELAALK